MKALLFAWLALAAASAGAEECPDPIFTQFRARIEERPSARDRAAGWEEFLALHSANPCAKEARARLSALEPSLAADAAASERFRQEARGGVIEPDRSPFPGHSVLRDAPGVNEVRLLTEVIALAEGFKPSGGPNALLEANTLWTQVLRGELAPIPQLALSLDLPFLAGDVDGQGFRWALGNLALGIRGIFGTRLGTAGLPLAVSVGILWVPGNSVWSGEECRDLLNAAAVAAFTTRHLFRFDQPDYALNATAQLSLGTNALGLGFQYHIWASGEMVEKLLRIDLAWDWTLTDWFALGVELNGAFGDAQAIVGATETETIASLLASPGVRFSFGRTSALLALRVPLLDAARPAQILGTLELGVRL